MTVFRDDITHGPITHGPITYPTSTRARGTGHRSSSASSIRALAIGAHPDDVELACGGTLSLLAAAGACVHAMVMSQGCRGATLGDGGRRADEARVSAGQLGVSSVEVFGFPDTELDRHENQMADAIEEAIDRCQPDVVFTHSSNDQHQDHRAVHLATLRGARRHRAILCFESPSATLSFQPTMFVDIEGHLDAKVAAIALHVDQSSKPYVDPDVVRGQATFRGSQARTRHAEAFESVRFSPLWFLDAA